VHNPDRTFDRAKLSMMLRTRLAATQGLGGNYGANKGHRSTGAARQVPNLFYSARIDVPHKRY
jgi:hypothetical protein